MRNISSSAISDYFSNDETDDLLSAFTVISFFLLGIERVLYAYCFLFTDGFKRACRAGTFGSKIREEEHYWRCMQILGMYVKVFQFGVGLADFFVVKRTAISFVPEQLAFGLFLVAVGQVLNYSVFRALGAKGVYYGYEFGYEVEYVTCFPYNLNINDPQYWGVLLTVWGTYVGVGASNYLVPAMETFWYLMSMKVFENDLGRKIVAKLRGITASSKVHSD